MVNSGPFARHADFSRRDSVMNAILLTALVLSGANGLHAGWGGSYAAENCDSCDDGGNDDYRRGMPQSCYNPSFGCYPSTRFMHRYPAFHNYYYRSAYNYRHYFDYPWHAGQHEPTSMFSYGVPREAAPDNVPVPIPAPMASRREPTPAFRSADHLAPIVSPGAVYR
jgi:hypothetical protein